jgi:hypothetical protein
VASIRVWSSWRSVSSSTCAPPATCAGAVKSSGLWLIPPRLGTKRSPIGRWGASTLASCPAQMGRRAARNPRRPASSRASATTRSSRSTGGVSSHGAAPTWTPSAAADRCAASSTATRRWRSRSSLPLRSSTRSRPTPGTTLAAPGRTSSCPTVPTASPTASASSRTARTRRAPAASASRRASMGSCPRRERMAQAHTGVAQRLRAFHRRHDAERPVAGASLGDRIEVRSRGERRTVPLRGPDEVPAASTQTGRPAPSIHPATGRHASVWAGVKAKRLIPPAASRPTAASACSLAERRSGRTRTSTVTPDGPMLPSPAARPPRRRGPQGGPARTWRQPVPAGGGRRRDGPSPAPWSGGCGGRARSRY